MKSRLFKTRLTVTVLKLDWLAATCAFALAMACALAGPTAAADAPKGATQATKAANAAVLQALPFGDKKSFEDAQRGFIAPLSEEVIKAQDGRPVWDPKKYAFIKPGADAPETVNPSLWRQSQLINIAGLFKVVDRIYQVRNQDLSNMSIVEGDTGLIIIDPLISAETATAALNLYYQHRPKKPVVAVIYSHSHVDHYGGVRGVVNEADVKAGKVQIYAPDGFLEAAVAENVMAGTAMSRRATYMYGNLLPPDPKGQVGAGLGTTTSSGTVTLIAPTKTISKTGQKEKISGLTFEFMLAPGTEAPSEMHWHIEELKATSTAENACHTLHNTYSLRGAKIRDPLAWSKYLDDTLARWSAKTEVLFGMHHWPVFGNAEVIKHLKSQRDMYRYINDQTLRLANHGETMVEIAEDVQLPRAWRTIGRTAATTGASITTSRLPTCCTWDGSTATPRPCMCTRRSTHPSVTSNSWAARTRCSRTPRPLRQGRLSMGGGGGEPRGLRRSEQSGGPQLAGRRLGATRLSGRERHVAQFLPDRGKGAA